MNFSVKDLSAVDLTVDLVGRAAMIWASVNLFAVGQSAVDLAMDFVDLPTMDLAMDLVMNLSAVVLKRRRKVHGKIRGR